MTTPYLNEAQNLYEEKEYGECLQLLYKQNTTAQWCVWSIILFSLLIDGLTIFVSVYLKQFTTVAALVAGAAGVALVAGVALSAGLAFVAGAAVAVATTIAWRAGMGFAGLATFAGTMFSFLSFPLS